MDDLSAPPKALRPAPLWQRVGASILRITGTVGGLLILLLAALKGWQEGRIAWDLWVIGVGYPVLMAWLARLLLRSRE
ncbi:MAG: hypothetical protein U1F26_00220 [Lysobacterales bacterium]